jgi:protein-arginine kinase activator protein McsA
MSCRICDKNSCTESFHSIHEQNKAEKGYCATCDKLAGECDCAENGRDAEFIPAKY